MARGRAPRVPRGNPRLRNDYGTTDEAVASAGSSRGRHTVSSPAAMRKSKCISYLTTAAIANIGQGGGNPGTPPPQNRRRRVRDGGDDAGIAQQRSGGGESEGRRGHGELDFFLFLPK